MARRLGYILVDLRASVLSAIDFVCFTVFFLGTTILGMVIGEFIWNNLI
jgi:hypothetical protein